MKLNVTYVYAYTIHLFLSVSPIISPQVVDQTRNEGQSASFTCQATGQPVPTISWYFNGILLGNGAKYTISETSVNTTTISSTLTIMSAQSSDVGTYTCNATNVVSTDTSSGVLTVNGELLKLLSFISKTCSSPYHYQTNDRTTV